MTKTLAVVALGGLFSWLGGEAHRRTEKGNELFVEGKNDPALSEYQKAQNAAPEAPQLHYDVGNVLYRQENWEGAAEAYERALGAAGPDLAPRAAYNLGNAYFRDGKYDEAVRAYTRTLRAQPADEDAKRNLELALRALEQQKKNQKPNQGQPQGQKPQDQKDQSKGQDDKDKDGKGGGAQGKKDDKPQQKPGGMTAEEAKKLLDRLNDQERQNIKREQARQPKDEHVPEKDW